MQQYSPQQTHISVVHKTYVSQQKQARVDERFVSLATKNLGRAAPLHANASASGSMAQSSSAAALAPAASSSKGDCMVSAGGEPSQTVAAVPKAKAKQNRGSCQSGGAAQAVKSAAKGRGRPKRDAATLLRAALREFSVADASSKYFTNEWKSVVRNWLNYLTDLAKMIEAEEDAGVLEELAVLEKKVLVVKAVCTKLHAAGATSTETLKCYMSQLHFMTLEPVCENPFPPYLRRLMHSQDVEDTWLAGNFWEKLHDEVLVEMMSPSETIEDFQMRTVTAKIMLIAQADSEQQVFADLLSFCRAFPTCGKIKSGKVGCRQVEFWASLRRCARGSHWSSKPPEICFPHLASWRGTWGLEAIPAPWRIRCLAEAPSWIRGHAPLVQYSSRDEHSDYLCRDDSACEAGITYALCKAWLPHHTTPQGAT